MRGLVGIHMWVVWVWHTCVLVWRTTALPRHSYSTVCLRMRVCVCVCVKRDSPATKKCFHLSCQPHTSFGCVAGTLWSLRSPQMIQGPTVIQPPLFGRKEMEHRKRIIGEEWVGWELWLWESWSVEKQKEEQTWGAFLCVPFQSLLAGTAAPHSVSSALWRRKAHGTGDHFHHLLSKYIYDQFMSIDLI